VSDELLGEIIANKLRHSDVVVSFAEIARVAKKENRKPLAAIVSEFSTASIILPSHPVHLFVDLGACIDMLLLLLLLSLLLLLLLFDGHAEVGHSFGQGH